MHYVDKRWGGSLAAAFASLLLLLSPVSSLAADDSNNRFLTAAQDLKFVLRSLERERQYAVPSVPITGITIPHHLLAADLIARGVLAASGGRYDHVLIISPDHFRSLKTPFGITSEDLETSAGPLIADRPFAQKVRAASKMFSDIGAAPQEHGIHAITPFIRAIFPGVRIAAVTTATGCTPAQLRTAAELIGGLVQPKTLVIQSTDYSHFLPDKIAALRDQETISALASGDPKAVLSLTQPDHMDSRASQFIQMTLQQKLYNATPVIVANRNAHDYIPGMGSTTTYVVTVYTPTPERGWRLRYPDQTVTYFGGIVGRAWTEPAMSEAAIDRLRRRIEKFTGGLPLVLSLEDVESDERSRGESDAQHPILSRPALADLKMLGLVAVNGANSRAHDFGQEGLDEPARLLEASGIRILRPNVATQLGAASVVPLTFFRDHDVVGSVRQLNSVCALQVSSPTIVLAHWKGDDADTSETFEKEVLDRLANCGIAALIGVHPHRVSTKAVLRAGGAFQSVFSMGNLISDQSGSDVAASIIEMRVFQHGTVALRTIPIPNFSEEFKSSD